MLTGRAMSAVLPVENVCCGKRRSAGILSGADILLLGLMSETAVRSARLVMSFGEEWKKVLRNI